MVLLLLSVVFLRLFMLQVALCGRIFLNIPSSKYATSNKKKNVHAQFYAWTFKVWSDVQKSSVFWWSSFQDYLIVICHFETSFAHCACSDAMASSFWHVLFINGPHGGFLNNMALSQGDEMRLPWISPRSRTKSFTKSPTTYSAQFAHNFILFLVMHLG